MALETDDAPGVPDELPGLTMPYAYPNPLIPQKDPAGGSWERQHQNFEQRWPKEYYDPVNTLGVPATKAPNFNWDTKQWDLIATDKSRFPSPFLDINKYTPQPPTSKPDEPSPALKFWEHPSPKKIIPIREGYKLTPVDHDPFAVQPTAGGTKLAENERPSHPPIQIDVMNAGTGIHSGPGNALIGGRGSEGMAKINKDLQAPGSPDTAVPDMHAKRELEMLEAYKNWRESLGITTKLQSGKPELKSIPGGKDE